MLMPAPALLRRSLIPAIVAALLALTFTVSSARASDNHVIIIDGKFDDWENVPAALMDPADAPNAEVDFRQIKVVSDEEFIHIYAELTRTVNLQGLDGRVRILIDADGDPRTGQALHDMPGVDVVLEFSPRSERRPDVAGRGAAIHIVAASERDRNRETRLAGSDGGLMFAPTYASDRVEIRFDRSLAVPGRPHAFKEQIAFRLVYLGPDGAVQDETATIRHRLGGPVSFDGGFTDRDPRKRAEGTDFRVASWNGEHGAILHRRDISLRMLRAINPDIVLLQELQPAQSAEELQHLFNELGGEWTVIIGDGGGNLRCGIATRFPLTDAPDAARIPFPGRSNWLVRASAIGVRAADRPLLLLSTHLKCCGRLGDESDQRRENEARGINESVRGDLRSGRFHGAVIGGDLNLVGGYTPLTLLRSRVDANDRDLEVLEPMQPCGRTNATWYEPGNAFTTGRLDFLLSTPSSLRVLNTFVFNTDRLDDAVLERHGLQRDDAEKATDHFAVIADFAWHAAAATASEGAAPR